LQHVFNASGIYEIGFLRHARANTGFVQVLRYSALGCGIFYGLYHQAKLSSAAKLAAVNREYEHKQQLIEKAKAEYTKKNLPQSQKTEGGDSTLDQTSFLPNVV
jgi:F-type H+-transporting ATP synthase subunit e